LPAGEVIEGDRLMVSVGNGVSAGGGFFLTPNARPDDGLIDVCVVDKMRRGRILRLLPLALKGRHVDKDGVTMLRVPSLTVECEHPLHLHIDGEYLGDDKSPLSFTVLEGRLPVLCLKDKPPVLSRPLVKIL
jgi:diacylglycerol kinase family enzyme